MALAEYRRKRSFSSTPEPTGGASAGRKLQFVVQKHAASRLHYDFRLEMGGALKSWAVPKGPSMNPADKRLALLVEDHPFDYKDFEGIIPPGNYGAGSVIIWDRGTYSPAEPAKSKSEQEKTLLHGFHAGQIKVRLRGKKLKGDFVLVKTSGRTGDAWLLIKHRDEFATTSDITAQEQSVVSGKTIAEMEGKAKADELTKNRPSGTRPATSRRAGKASRQPKHKVSKRKRPG